MTYSGSLYNAVQMTIERVLIPLLLDDLLWAMMFPQAAENVEVLIPLLLDDLLWETSLLVFGDIKIRLNPSFAG